MIDMEKSIDRKDIQPGDIIRVHYGNLGEWASAFVGKAHKDPTYGMTIERPSLSAVGGAPHRQLVSVIREDAQFYLVHRPEKTEPILARVLHPFDDKPVDRSVEVAIAPGLSLYKNGRIEVNEEGTLFIYGAHLSDVTKPGLPPAGLGDRIIVKPKPGQVIMMSHGNNQIVRQKADGSWPGFTRREGDHVTFVGHPNPSPTPVERPYPYFLGPHVPAENFPTYDKREEQRKKVDLVLSNFPDLTYVGTGVGRFLLFEHPDRKDTFWLNHDFRSDRYWRTRVKNWIEKGNGFA